MQLFLSSKGKDSSAGLRSRGLMFPGHRPLDHALRPMDSRANTASDESHDPNACHPRQPFGRGTRPGERHDRRIARDGGNQEYQGQGIVGRVKESGEREAIHETEHAADLGIADR